MSRDCAQQCLHARLRLPQSVRRNASRIGAAVLGDLVEEAFDRERVVGVADAAKGASRAPRVSMTCSASLLGSDTSESGEPFMTIWSTRGGGAPRGDRHVGGDQLGDHAVMPGDEPAIGIEARLDVMRGHGPELAAA